MHYVFQIPVIGYEVVTVKADSEEEAVALVRSGVDTDYQELDWNDGGLNTNLFLADCIVDQFEGSTIE